QVATDAGEPVGTVLDVLVRGGTSGQVVAFRLAAHRGLAPGSRHHRHRVYVPRGETRSADGRTLIIPEHATTYVSDDLPDFVTRVGAFHQGEGVLFRDAPLPGAGPARADGRGRPPARYGACADRRRRDRDGHPCAHPAGSAARGDGGTLARRGRRDGGPG